MVIVTFLTGVGTPGPPGPKGEPGSFVPTSGWYNIIKLTYTIDTPVHKRPVKCSCKGL